MSVLVFPILSTEDQISRNRNFPVDLEDFRQTTSFATKISRGRAAIDPVKIVKISVRLCYQIQGSPLWGDLDISQCIFGPWRGPVKSFEITTPSGKDPLIFIVSCRMNHKNVVPYVLKRSKESVIFDYEITTLFDSWASRCCPTITINYWEHFCRNFEGIKLISGHSVILVHITE